MTGRVCGHCKLDTDVLAYEMRLYAVHTRAMAAGQVVTAEEALRQVKRTFLGSLCMELHVDLHARRLHCASSTACQSGHLPNCTAAHECM